jgi:hypothetical protein
MKINMKNLNVFRRLDELETANLHLNAMLKSTRLELTALKSGITILHNAIQRPVVTPKPAPKPAPKAVRTKDALNAVAEKKREYARRYYAKRKAALAFLKAAA